MTVFDSIRLDMINTIVTIVRERYHDKYDDIFISLNNNEVEVFEEHIISDCLVKGIYYNEKCLEMTLKCYDTYSKKYFEMPMRILDYYNIGELLKQLI